MSRRIQDGRRALAVLRLLAVAVCWAGLGRASSAADLYWTGTTSPSNLWSNVLAWSTSPSAASPQPAAVPGSADNTYFGISSIVLPQTVLLGGNQAAQGLIFTSTAATTLLGSSGTTPAASLLTLGTAGITVNRGAGIATIGSAGVDTVSLSLTDSQGWSVASGGQLVVRNGVVGTAATAASETLMIGGFGPAAVTGVIGDGSSGGVLNLTKTGWGSLRLSGANTFTGTTTVSGGVLVVANNSALGTGTSVVTVSGPNGTNRTASATSMGGALLLDGLAGGLNVSRSLSLQGYGPNASYGTSAAIAGYSLVSIGDNALSGAVATAAGGVATRIIANAGTLSFASSGTLTAGVVSGDGAVLADSVVGMYGINGTLSGSGGLVLNRTFLSPVASGSFSGILSFVSGRITQNGVVGSSAGAGTAAPVSVGANVGGFLEIRMDSPQLELSGTSAGNNANIYMRNNGGSTNATLFLDHSPGGVRVNGGLSLGNIAVNVATGAAAGIFTSRNGYGITAASLTTPTTTSANNMNVTNNLSGTLAVSGTLWNTAVTTAANTLTINGSGFTVVQGDLIANGGASFDHAFTKGGTGLVSISGTASTLDGVVTVQDGQLQITDFRSLGTANTSAINLGSAATTGGLVIGTSVSPTSGGLSTSRVINLSGTTGGGTIIASQSGANPVVISANLTAAGTGNKTLTLGGTSTLDNVIAGSIPNAAGSTTVSLAKIGGGVWVLSGTNAFTGAATLSDGTLKLQANSAAPSGVLQDTVGITFDATNGFAGATLEYTGTGGSTAEVVGALTPTAGGNTVRVTPGSGTVGLRAASLGTVNGGATVNIVGSSSGTFSFATAPTTNNMANAGLYYNGADFAYVVGNNTPVRAPVYGTDADFVVASSALTAGQSNRLDGTFSSGAVAIDSLKVNGSQSLTMTGTLTVQTGAAANASGGILQTAGSGTVAGTAVTTNGSGALVVRVDGSSDSLLLSAPIAATTTGGLTKSGAGVLLLSASNAQTGATTVNEGTVRLASGGRLSADNQSLTIRQAGTLDLNGISTGAAVGGFANMGTVTNSGAAAATLTVGNNNGTGTSYGLVQDGVGVVNVTKVGTGAQSWLGMSTYTGTTTIGSSGLVTVDVLADIDQASGIGRGNVADNAGSLVFNGSTGGLAYQGNVVSGVTVVGSRSAETNRLFTLAGTGATIASNVSNGNAIRWSSTGAIAFGSGVTAAQTITFDGSSTGDNVFLPRITNNTNAGNAATSVTKTGTGIWVLAGSSNSYTGATTISNGFLALSNTGALPANSPVALGTGSTAAILMASGTFDRPIAASAVAGVGSITIGGSAGSGFAAYGDKLTVAIGGAANPTALTWGSGGFNPSSLILGAATGLAEVEFRNPVNLNGAARTITVNDNANTFADFATVSGTISGSGGLVKSGAGVLALTGANTYSGSTRFNGLLQVTSLGLSTAPGPSSVGTSVNGNVDSGAVMLGDGASTASSNSATLTYVGGGETSDRKIRLGTGAGAVTAINANGSGPLVLTNVVNDGLSGARTLVLQGSNTDFNEVRSSLADFGGALTVNIANATWILSGSNSFSGGVGFASGAVGGSVGIGNDSALGAVTGTATLTYGQFFAWGGDRVVQNPSSWGGNSTVTSFAGDYNLRFSGSSSYLGGATVNLYNTASSAATLQFDTLVMTGTADSTLALAGDGNTTIGTITSATTFAVALTKNGSGVLTLGTGSQANFQANAGAITMNAGTLNIRVPVTARAVTLASGTISGTSTLSGTSYSVTNASGTTAISVSLLGSGTLGKSGAGTLLLSGSNTYSGTTTVSGGVLSISSTSSLPGWNTPGRYTISAGAALVVGNAVSDTDFNTIRTTGSFAANAAIGFDTSAGNRTYAGSAIANSGTTLGLTKIGSGTLTMNVANTYTGTTTIREGVLRLGVAGALPANSPLALTDGGLDMATSATAAAVSITGTGSIIGGSTLTGTSFTISNTTGTVVVSAPLAGASAAFTKSNAGTATLSGLSTFGGVTTVSGGVLEYTSIANAGTGNASALGAPASANATIALSNGATLRYTGTGVHSSDRTINLNTASTGTAMLEAMGSGSVTLGPVTTANNMTKTLVLSGTSTSNNSIGTITETGTSITAVLKTGVGRWILASGSSNFGGGVVVQQGELVMGASMVSNPAPGAATPIGASGTVALGSNTVSGTAAFLLGNNITFSSRNISVSGSATQVAILGSTGTSGTATFSSTGTPSIFLARDVTLQAASGGTVEFQNRWVDLSGSFAPSANVTIGSAGNLGTVVLRSTAANSGTLTTSGAINVNYGTLQVANAGLLPSTSAINVNGATLQTVDYNASAPLTLDSSGLATISGTGLSVSGAVTNANTASNALTFSSSTGTITLSSLSGAGSTLFSSNATINGLGVTQGTVTVVGLLTGSIGGGSVTAGSLNSANVSGGSTTVTGNATIGSLTNGLATLNGVGTLTTVSGGTLGLNGATASIATLSGGRVNLANNVALSVAAGTFADAITGAGSLTKTTAGKLTLSGSNTYSGATGISAGTLAVDGSIASGVTVASGAILGGSGRITSNIGGDGLIAPGNSPGILQVDGQVIPTGSTSFAFEFTQTGDPTWSNATASGNDVLRLTNAAPFQTALTAPNVVSVYFDVASLVSGDIFRGGFFSDKTSGEINFASAIGSPTYAFYVYGSGSGGTNYNGKNYYTLAQYMAANPSVTGINTSVVTVGSANYANGTVTNGQVTQFVVVPEPATLALAAVGIGLGGWAAVRRRKK